MSIPDGGASPQTWRLLVDGPRDGAGNMAVDEAILARYADPERAPGSPTLRLYAFSPPAFSLGRRQAAEGSRDASFLESQGIDLVRRPTGGAAVLHEHERTYAVIGRLRREPFPGGVLDTYRRIAVALVAALRKLGLDAAAATGAIDPSAGAALCFERTAHHEIVIGATKLVGSAQLRRSGAFPQQGSILLTADPGRAARAKGGTPSGGRFAGIEDLLGRRVDLRELDVALIQAFENAFDAGLRTGELSASEAAHATCLRAKYASAEWTFGGGTRPRAAR